MVKIQGNDTFLSLGPVASSYGGALIGYCNRGLTINLTTELNEITAVDIDSVAFLPTFKNCTIEASFVLVEEADSGDFDFTDITDWWENSEPLLFSISYPIGAGVKLFQGSCYLAAVTPNMNYNEIATYNVSLQATGQISIYVS